MGDYLRVSGHEEIINVLKSIDKKSSTTICRKVARAGSKVFTQEAKLFAPKRSGELANDIKTRAPAQRKKGQVGAEAQVGKSGENTFYGAFVELGHFIGKKEKVIDQLTFEERDRKQRTYVPPNDFMQEAFQSKGLTLAKQLPNMFWDEIAREVSRTKRINVR